MNVFRLAGDFSHLLAIVILLVKIIKTKKCTGLSGKSQLLFALVFSTRYLDLFDYFYSYYNAVMKIIFIALTYLTVYLIYFHYSATYNKSDDTFYISLPILGSIVLAIFVHEASHVLELLWTFSIYLESVAILPQLHMIVNTGEAETITYHYLFALGLYRALYICNWIYRYVIDNWIDIIPLVAGCVQTVFYFDFFYLYFTRVVRGKSLSINV